MYIYETHVWLCLEFNPENGAEYYKINWRGKVFIEDGGYVNVEREKSNQTEYERRRDYMLVLGSWGAAIGAVGVVVVELLKQFVWQSCR